MNNKYRLSSNNFEREEESAKIKPLKIIFLSVEGNATEKEYFQGISKNRKSLNINTRIDVEVLRRSSKDNRSAPIQVIELLEEYLRLREIGEEGMIKDIPPEFINKYGQNFIYKYLNDPNSIPAKRRNGFETALMLIGYDINYRKFLNQYNNELDEFAILIDRDKQAHSKDNMINCIKYCEKKKWDCYITNPCFEFWLLLHLSDIKEEYKDRIPQIISNVKLTNNHTYVSNELSMKAHHNKSGINFNVNYLHKVDDAIKRAQDFESDETGLIDNIGSNIWKLIKKMKNF